MWEDNKSKLFDQTNFKMAEIHALITSLKVICSESTNKSLSETRQACGGLGMSQFAGIGFRMNDHEVQLTWEGDNNVLIQQSAKYLLDLLKMKFKGKDIESDTCADWLTLIPVFEDKFEANTIEEITSEALEKALEHRINFSLQ